MGLTLFPHFTHPKTTTKQLFLFWMVLLFHNFFPVLFCAAVEFLSNSLHLQCRRWDGVGWYRLWVSDLPKRCGFGYRCCICSQFKTLASTNRAVGTVEGICFGDKNHIFFSSIFCHILSLNHANSDTQVFTQTFQTECRCLANEPSSVSIQSGHEARAMGFIETYAVAEAEDGRWGHVHFTGPEGYEAGHPQLWGFEGWVLICFDVLFPFFSYILNCFDVFLRGWGEGRGWYFTLMLVCLYCLIGLLMLFPRTGRKRAFLPLLLPME